MMANCRPPPGLSRQFLIGHDIYYAMVGGGSMVEQRGYWTSVCRHTPSFLLITINSDQRAVCQPSRYRLCTPLPLFCLLPALFTVESISFALLTFLPHVCDRRYPVHIFALCCCVHALFLMCAEISSAHRRRLPGSGKSRRSDKRTRRRAGGPPT